jgi:2-polyprenyl-3-methyl-5-hydroxy-6-metoxy-1,4-benzoquinol methylase
LDKAGKSYWDSKWEYAYLPDTINPYRPDSDHYIDRMFHDFFRGVFAGKETENNRLLEIGCARSVWLPYFAKEFGFRVYGIDYSKTGCQQALQLLANEGVEGKIVCADFFSPPESMIEGFDVVVSFGVLEHFENTEGCIFAFSRYLKHKGMLIVNIPNMSGLIGRIQKFVNRNVFDIHVPLTPESIMEAHRMNGLEPVSCNYFLFANLGVLNFENLEGSPLYQWVLQTFCWLNRTIWFFEHLIPVAPNRWSSPYINCVAIKP